MCVKNRMTWTLMFLFLSGVLCSVWKVDYRQRHVCAVKGSPAVLLCTFHYPAKLRVHGVLWGHERSHFFKGPFIFSSRLKNGSKRFQYIGDRSHNCSLKINQVQHEDAGEYAFRFMTNSIRGKMTGPNGPRLKVVDLDVAVAKANKKSAVMEGDSVNLTCVNKCDGGNQSSSFTWFKNGEATHEGPVLYLRNISSTSLGNYSCSLKSDNGSVSTAKHINVEYGPKNTSASARPLVEVDIGSHITLICSSQANPPVENYTWFALIDNRTVAVGDQPELHFPKFHPNDGGKYLCSVTNRHGSQNSSVVLLRVKDESTLTRGILIAGTVALLLIVTAGIAIRSLCHKEVQVPKTDSAGNLQDTAVYVNWSPCDSGRSQDGNTCEAETLEVIYTTVYFNTDRKSDRKQQVELKNDEVIYSTVCGNQALNPPYLQPQ